jgi:IS30 family transposase
MAGGYQHVTQEQRYMIWALRSKGTVQREIAETLGLSASTVCRELKRNSGQRGYRPRQAQRLSEERQAYRSRNRKFTPGVLQIVEEGLRKDRSPEQIVGERRRNKIACVSIERIYQHVWQDKATGGVLYKHLRSGRRQRRKRYGSKSSRGIIPNRKPISSRPKAVEKRRQFGHWEADTMIGKNHKQALVTIVERKTGYLRIRRVERKTAQAVARACVKLLKQDSACVRTITTDNGKEFAGYLEIESELHTKVYFADPYSAWQRGTNENTNGLIRQYIPKSRPLESVTDQEIRWIEDRLNNRPRKRLGFKSPNQVYFHNKRRVALRT